MRAPFLIGLALIATPALAATNDDGVVRLSAQEREDAISAAAARRDAEELPINGLDRQIHGEVGMSIGTGGYRSMYGTAVVPLGDSGFLSMSYATGRMNRARFR